jgi:hypothetical protein
MTEARRGHPTWSNYADEDDWYDKGSKRTTDAARRTAEAFFLCPTTDGGVQIEVHAGDVDFELEIDPDGSIRSIFWDRTS